MEVFVVRHRASAGVLAGFAATLADEERARANRFHQERDRIAYTISHGVLRTIVSHVLGTSPRSVVFREAANGKPEIADSNLRFNLSHSGDYTSLALSKGIEVGVDIEEIRPDFDMAAVARRYFHPAEAAELERMTADSRCKAFFQAWTRMEAYLKATGVGIKGLDRFHAGIEPGWCLHDLAAPEGYAASLVYCGESQSVMEHAPLDAGDVLAKLARAGV